jgi:hypothetical protein
MINRTQQFVIGIDNGYRVVELGCIGDQGFD